MSEKKKRRRYSATFKREAVGRMRECQNITALTRELGIDRKMLYQWKWQEEGQPARKPLRLTTQAAENGSLQTLRRDNAHLKRVLAEKALEVDFFKAASTASSSGTPPGSSRESSTGSSPRSCIRTSR